MPLQAQQLIAGRYELTRILGEGGFGVVWLALDTTTDRTVAIKFLKRGGEVAGRRFEVEVRVLELIDHPNCVRALDSGRAADGAPFVVTDFVRGTSFEQWIGSGPSTDDIIDAATQVASALSAAHRAGIVHRDLKPANLLCDRDPAGNLMVHVLDFGIAKLSGFEQTDITKTGEILGTPGYMSPEQLRGTRDVGPAADLYALGVLLFEMLEGRHPFVADTALGLAMAHLAEPAPAVTRKVPAGLVSLVASLLEKDPTRRPGSAANVQRQLAEIRTPTTRVANTTTPTRRWPNWGVLVLCVAALGLLAVVGFVVRDDAAETPKPDPPRLRDNPLVQPVAATSADSGSLPGADQGPAADAELPDCTGKPALAAGIREVGYAEDLVTVRIPRNYNPARAYPMIVVFHDGLQSPTNILEELDFGSARNAENYVFVAPQGDGIETFSKHWAQRVIKRALLRVQVAEADLCVDRSRVYALGYGLGGRAAHEMLCRRPETRAVATYAHRFTIAEARCSPAEARAALFITPTDDPVYPQNGGLGCLKNRVKSVDEHSRLVRREVAGCAPGAQPTRDGQCERWSCPTRYEHCAVPGGHTWPNRGSHVGFVLELNACGDNPPVDFGVTAKMIGFFDTIDETR